jgi:hypothetical protein
MNNAAARSIIFDFDDGDTISLVLGFRAIELALHAATRQGFIE